MLERSYPGLLAGGWRDLAYEPFRDGIRCTGWCAAVPDEPSLAILRYEPGARVPRHLHAGWRRSWFSMARRATRTATTRRAPW